MLFCSDLKKKIFLFSAVAVLILSTGCGSTAFFAVSSSREHTGGIYRIHGDRCYRAVVFPTLNLLLHDQQQGRIYGTSNRIPGTQSKDGGLSVFENRNGKWRAVQTLAVNGKTPCHIALSPCRKFLYTANYTSGDLSQFELDPDKKLSFSRLIRHSGSSITGRQRTPHPHCVVFDPAGKQLFVCDLGTDEVVIYNFTEKKGLQLPAAQKIKLLPGSGPRHLVFDPAGTVFYTANELNSTASSFVKDPYGTWKLHRSCSTLTPGTTKQNAPGAIKISSDGKYFFVTNRGDDSIAVFSADRKGDFKLNYTISSGGNFPSDILLFESRKQVAISHLKSGTISLFTWDPESGTLTGSRPLATVPSSIGLSH